ncbi:hypothetical protein HDG34_003238 [Paraburkholderia sp. HC6.4b]|uniref:hypothetical protein n=1 Tax=unclassified Paraburkholderia TaxID=2615204 RepID=UPI00160A586B|nr:MULTISPECIES: hypothetical protein [unclassified Paraburkholderia]MBB5409297.1 hypothetical protein [Paraburkholderia sp. HC6.4b]MBB5451025.1 hypothetical protein [Paraburkholderia sp. Kb1A]
MVKVKQSNADEILAAFLQSDCGRWLIEVNPTRIEGDAKFVCTLDVNGVPFDYSVLVRKATLDELRNAERVILLECAPEGIPTAVYKCEKRVVLSGSGTDIAALDWSEADEPIVRKVADIVKSRPRVITPNYNAKIVESQEGGLTWIVLPNN